MGKMVFMTFEHKKKKKVQVLSVSGENRPAPDKVNLDAKAKPQNAWMKSKKNLNYRIDLFEHRPRLSEPSRLNKIFVANILP